MNGFRALVIYGEDSLNGSSIEYHASVWRSADMSGDTEIGMVTRGKIETL